MVLFRKADSSDPNVVVIHESHLYQITYHLDLLIEYKSNIAVNLIVLSL